eukprot:10147891-Ditylum_brightwellii.AAC.1
MGAFEGEVCCCEFCDRGVQGHVDLDAGGTMKKGCKSMLQNPIFAIWLWDFSLLGWVDLDADGTMKKGCESMLRNPM